MTPVSNESDYLVIGGGATAMAFVDSLLSEQPQATVTIVDRRHRPGGHWNDAYPFVRLHQPSAWYGVASQELASGSKDAVGPNRGLYSLASGHEVLAHFDQVMQQRFLPSGRVRWMPMSEYALDADGSHRITSLTSGEVQAVTVRRKVVDATHARTEVPATRPPRYAVAPGVACVPVNGLPGITRPHAAYTVIGSGKTGIDACLWLLEQGVPASRIRWVMPRDAWYMDRANFQPGLENFEHNMAYNCAQFDAMAQATSVPDLFACLEAAGVLHRLDPAVQPTTFRCAVVSQGEAALLRGISDVVRLGRVQAIEPTRLVLEQGSAPADPDTLYIDCSACAIQIPPALPVFDGARINLFMLRMCQPLFSAALIAYVESHMADAAEQNALCRPVPSPEVPSDWVRMWAVSLANLGRWRQNAGLNAWLMRCRLNGAAVQMRGVSPDDAARMALVKAMGASAAAAGANLPVLLGQLQRVETPA
jgi:hypothetical protein